MTMLFDVRHLANSSKPVKAGAEGRVARMTPPPRMAAVTRETTIITGLFIYSLQQSTNLLTISSYDQEPWGRGSVTFLTP